MPREANQKNSLVRIEGIHFSGNRQLLCDPALVRSQESTNVAKDTHDQALLRQWTLNVRSHKRYKHYSSASTSDLAPAENNPILRSPTASRRSRRTESMGILFRTYYHIRTKPQTVTTGRDLDDTRDFVGTGGCRTSTRTQKEDLSGTGASLQRGPLSRRPCQLNDGSPSTGRQPVGTGARPYTGPVDYAKSGAHGLTRQPV
ncbi:hypothetical protein GGX14DRAFT_390223 [Mycena pura]|uniref:Uncharacterized protein n=1 Tax=Mycena pura TaxID=153505 RepID=A0AAD6VNQ1_9AGAR|nr:hypothetical protein GGX14DRAFT_390223 [Mycena pura]